jgi:RES domain
MHVDLKHCMRAASIFCHPYTLSPARALKPSPKGEGFYPPRGRTVNSALTLKRSLHLIDLGTIALHKFGIKRTQLIDITEVHYPRTRRWAQAYYKQFPKAQGLRWTSCQDDHAHAVVLFGNRIRPSDLSTKSDRMPPILDGEAILTVLDLAIRLGVILAE